MKIKSLLGWLTAFTLAVGTAGSLHAAQIKWASSPANANWSNSSNWNAAFANNDVLEFGTSSTTTLNNDETAGTSVGGFIFDVGANAFTLNGNAIVLTGNIANNSSYTQTFGMQITTSNANRTFTGGALTFNGLWINGGSNLVTINNTGTVTFAGGITHPSSGSTGRPVEFAGTGNIVVSSAISDYSGGGETSGLEYFGSGSLTLSGNNTFTAGSTFAGGVLGATAGTVILSGNGYLSGGAVTIGNSTTNGVVNVQGNYTIGQTGNATLVLTGGNGTTTSQGTLSLEDGSINTLTINSGAAAGAVIMTLGSTAAGANLMFDVSGAGADKIALGSGYHATVSNTVNVSLNVIGALNGTTYNILTTSNTSPFTIGSGNNFQLVSASVNSGNFGGYVLGLSGATTGDLSVTQIANTTPTNAYWSGPLTGVNAGVWNGFTGGNANNSNWVNAASGGTDTNQSPGSTTNVFFSASGGGSNLSTTLGANTTINSLEFTSAADTGHQVTIGGANTLTINAGSGTGITVDASSGSHTINAPVALGANQTWAINNAYSLPLTVNGPVSDGGHAYSLTKSGVGELVLNGTSTYTGATSVNNGTLLVNGQLNLNSSVTVNETNTTGTAAIGGTGTINGAVSLTGYTATNYANMITGGDIGTTGTLTLANGLTMGAGAIAYFDISSSTNHDFINITGGGFSPSSGAIIEVPALLTSGTYNLMGGTGLSSVSNLTLDYIGGGAAGGTYALQLNGSATLELVVTALTQASPSVSLNNIRVMQNNAFSVTGAVGNFAGGASLSGSLTDGGGTLTVASITPGNPVAVSTGTSVAITGNVASSGSTLGNQTVIIDVADPNANPTSASGTATVSVLQDRVVSASSVTFGPVHVNASLSGTTTLYSPGADSSNTRVTVPNTTSADTNGISVTGGSPLNTFNGTWTTDTRFLSGSLTSLGSVSSTITLLTGSEAGLTGQSPVNVPVAYTAQVFSGKAGWALSGGGTWGANANWADTLQGGIIPGAPGLAGAVSAGDTATFAEVSGGAVTITLDGVSPSLAGINFNATSTTYTVNPGTGNGTINLQSASTPISVIGNTATIGAVLSGNGLSVTGGGTLVLNGSNTYTGSTTVANGILQVGAGATGANRLPSTTSVILGDGGSNSGQLVLGDGTSAQSQTLASLTTSGAGTANSVVGGYSSNSTLTINNGVSDTFSGTLGGGATNQNNLNLVKSGSGTLALTGNNTFTGTTALNGGILNLGSANAIADTTGITFTSGTLQWSAANTTDYSNLFTAGQAYKLDANGQTVTLNASNAAFANAAGSLTKSGSGTIILNNTSGYALANTYINGGILQATDTNLPNTAITLAGSIAAPAVFQSNGTLTRGIGTAYVAPTDGISWGNYAGFSALGGPLTITLTGNALVWSVNFGSSGTEQMNFGSTTSDSQVILTNGFSLGGAATGFATNRYIYVEKGTGTDSTLLSGNITDATGGTTPNGGNGIIKSGSGTLILGGANTFTGSTTVNAGTLRITNNSGLGFGGLQEYNATAAAPTVTVTGSSSVDLYGGVTVNKVISLGNTGSSLINSDAGTTSTIDNGIAYVMVTGTGTGAGAVYNTPLITVSGATGSGVSVALTKNTNSTIEGATESSAGTGYTGTITATIADSNGGTGTGATASAAISSVTLGTGTNNLIGGAGNLTINAVVSGAGGGFTKVGTGTVTLNGVNTYTGATSVTNGTLVVAGSINGSSAVGVSGNGNLTGIGTVGAVTVSAGTITPGASNSGYLTASSATFTGGALAISITGNGAGTQLKTTSGVALGSGLANLSLNVSYTPTYYLNNLASADSIVITLGGYSGTFGNTTSLASNPYYSSFSDLGYVTASNGSEWAVVYGPDDGVGAANEITLYAIPEPQTWAMLIGGLGVLLGTFRSRRNRS